MSPTFVAYMFTLKCNILFWVVGYRWWPIGGTWFLWNYNHHRFYRSRTDLAIDRNGPYFITLLLFQKLFGNLLGWQAKKLLFVCLGCCTFRIKRDCKRISTESIFLHFLAASSWNNPCTVDSVYEFYQFDAKFVPTSCSWVSNYTLLVSSVIISHRQRLI